MVDTTGSTAEATAAAAALEAVGSDSQSPMYNLLSPKSNSALRAPVFSPEAPAHTRSGPAASVDNSPAFTLSATPVQTFSSTTSSSAPHSAVKAPGSGLKSATGSVTKVSSATKPGGLRKANLPPSASKTKGDGSDEEGSTVSAQSKMSHRSVRSTRSSVTAASSVSRLASTMAAKPAGRFNTSTATARSSPGQDKDTAAALSASKGKKPVSKTGSPEGTPAVRRSVSASVTPGTKPPTPTSTLPPAAPRASPAPKPPSAVGTPPSGSTAAVVPEDHFVRPPSSVYVGCRVSINQKALIGSSPTTPTAIGSMNDTEDPTGIVRFIGFTSFAPGYWLGIELLTPTGKNNGSVHGVSYFKCMDNYGIFTRAKLVTVLSSGQPSTAVSGHAQTTSSMTTPARSSSRAPSLTKEDPYSPFSAETEHAGWSDDQKLSSLLKIKIAKMMFLLNRQVEIAEELENCWTPDNNIQTPSGSMAGMAKYLKMKEEINEMITLENRCIEDFTSRLGALS